LKDSSRRMSVLHDELYDTGVHYMECVHPKIFKAADNWRERYQKTRDQRIVYAQRRLTLLCTNISLGHALTLEDSPVPNILRTSFEQDIGYHNLIRNGIDARAYIDLCDLNRRLNKRGPYSGIFDSNADFIEIFSHSDGPS